MPDVTLEPRGRVTERRTIAPPNMRSPFVNETVRTAWLSIFLRVLSVGFLAAFIPWMTLILLNAPILAPGGALAPWLRFQPYNPHYESMLTVIHLTWAVMLWRASGNPAKHPLFIDFTMWANGAHGVLMLIVTPMQKGLVMTVIEGLPLLGIAAVLWWLRPRYPHRANAPA
jgi:hypothetical protein